MDRDHFVTHGWKQLFGNLLRSPVGQSVDQTLQGLSNLLAPETLAERLDSIAAEAGPGRVRGLDPTRAYPRPPGALADPAAFEDACTRCGDCIFACPYGAIHTVSADSGPILDPNLEACRLCPDFPCIAACRDGALVPLTSRELPFLGRAEYHANRCGNDSEKRTARMAHSGRSRPRLCRECEQSCPVPGVLSVDRRGRVSIAEHCTGCGLCAAACPETPRALEIVW